MIYVECVADDNLKGCRRKVCDHDAMTAVAVVVVAVVGGGGMSVLSSLRFLPFGAGSKAGVRLYVTVLVTTERTLTGCVTALLGASKYRRVALSIDQSAGENGENIMLFALIPVLGLGPQVLGEYAGDCGIRSRRRPTDVRREIGVGGTDADDLGPSLRVEEKLEAVEGFEVTDSLLMTESSDNDRWSALGGGLAAIGVRAFRKSM